MTTTLRNDATPLTSADAECVAHLLSCHDKRAASLLAAYVAETYSAGRTLDVWTLREVTALVTSALDAA